MLQNREILNNKTIVVTGGTGSFGKTLVKKLLDTDVNKIRIFSRDENKQDEMRNELSNNRLEFYIGDIREKGALDVCFTDADFVFHAAALKQVPSCEYFPFEAVKTNIIGSQNVLDSSIKNNIKNVVMLSTDKAVMPINAMGISKSMMEKLTFTYGFNQNSHIKTIFNVTRYGNVMGSRGSVIPIFISKMINNQEISVTDARMTRFMMSLEESVNLVLFAMKNGNQGELFVQKAPSASIEVLIEALEKIFNVKAKIKLIGFRHGEKMHETLLSADEAMRSEDLGDYFRVRPDNRDLNYSLPSENITRMNVEEFNSFNSKFLNVNELVDVLLKQEFVKKFLVN
jgi:UDP-N-acetylglucosamine 4,6-dehydratase/5-epimerase